MTLGPVDVLVLTALKEELDALLQVRASLCEPWTVLDGDPPLHIAVLEGRAGPIRVAAARLTKMGGIATAALATRLLEAVKPGCLAMCGVCAGHPEDTELGDVVIAERLFQHDEGKIRGDGLQGDLWVDALRDDWLHVAQDMTGPATEFDLHAEPGAEDWKWWFLDRLAAGRDPLKSAGLRRHIPDERRADYLGRLKSDRLVTLKGSLFALTKTGKAQLAEHQVMQGTLVTSHPFHVLVGPMGSGTAVEAGGALWERLARGGMRKVLAVEMEAAAIGRVAHDRGIRFAVTKGVMDHADPHKTDRFKPFAARASAEVLCRFLSAVVKAAPRTSVPPPLDVKPASHVEALPPLVLLVNIGDRGETPITAQRLRAAPGLGLEGAMYLELTREFDRSASDTSFWYALAVELDDLVGRAEAITPRQASRCIVAGQAPLPVFAYLGQKTRRVSLPITFVNLRSGGTVWDQIDEPQVGRAIGDDRFTSTLPPTGGDGPLVLAILCSSHYTLSHEALAPMLEGAGGRGIVPYTITYNEPPLAAPLTRDELEQLTGRVDAALAWLAKRRASGLTVVIAGPAWIAFWVGHRLDPDVLGRVQFPNFVQNRYVPALSIPMIASPARSTGTQPHAPWVFISYSHESEDHTGRVTKLANELCRQGLDVWIDRYVTEPPEGWPRWMRRQLVHADFVLVVCTATYRRRFEGDEERGDAHGKGVGWEGYLASALLYGDRARNRRFIPVLLEGATAGNIPVELRAVTQYRLPADMGDLLRRLAGRPPVERPSVAAGVSTPAQTVSSGRGEETAVTRRVQSEGVPEAVVEESLLTPPALPTELSGAGLRALMEFLVDSFGEGELRQMAFFYGGARVAAQLPGGSASLEEIAWSIVQVFARHGLLDDAFFAELERERARRIESIREIRSKLGGDSARSAGTRGRPASRAARRPSPPGAKTQRPAPVSLEGAESAPVAATTSPARKVPSSQPEVSSPPVSADLPRWSESEMEARLAAVLARSDKLTLSLDKRLPSKPSENRAMKPPERVARRIVALKKGLKATRTLVELCFDAVVGKDADARAERWVARELLCEWLPYGYPEIAQVVYLRVARTSPDGRNLEIRTAYDYFVEVHMARLDGRRCKFTKVSYDARGGRFVADGMLPLPPASPQRQSPDQIGELIVRIIRERFAASTEIDVKSRIKVEAKKGASLYVVVPAAQRPLWLPDTSIRQLNKLYPELRIAVMTSPPADDITEGESLIWTMFQDLFDDAKQEPR